MLLKQNAKKALSAARQLPLKIVIPGGIGLFLVIFYIFAFVISKPVEFSYAGDTCVRQLTLLPGLQKQVSANSDYSLKYDRVSKFGGVEIASTRACFVPVSTPKQGITKVSTSPYGGILFKKTFAVTVETTPTASVNILAKPIPTGKPLAIPLSVSDTVNDYHLRIGEKETNCTSKDAKLRCDVEKLALEQSKEYDAKLTRSFNKKSQVTLYKEKVTTLSATNVKASTVNQGQTIFDKPTGFEMEFDKPIVTADVKLSKKDGETRTPIAVTHATDGTKLRIQLAKELDRNSNYELNVDKLEAKDGSTLPVPYVAGFLVSGGPKLTGANVGATGAGLSQTVVLTFDQPIADAQDINKFVTAKGIGGTFVKKGNQVHFTYAGAPKCAGFTISIAKGLESNYQIAQTEVQNFSSRTVCHTVETIGVSKEGRAITAYFFGNGTQTVLFTGAIHGNEKSSKYILDSWITDLEAKAPTIPADKQVVVVPLVNPDGFYKYGRFNANGVNLNRNWQTYNWTKDPETSPGKVEPGIGGPAPMSEPETKVLAAFTQRLAPRLVATYHSQGRIVNSNDVGVALPLGQRYAQMAGYQFVADHQTTETFGVVVTGTYEDWLKERGVPGILMELNTNTGNHFAQNKAAMWMLITN